MIIKPKCMFIEVTHLVEKMQSKQIENIHTTTSSAKLKPCHYKTIHTQQTFKHYTTIAYTLFTASYGTDDIYSSTPQVDNKDILLAAGCKTNRLDALLNEHKGLMDPP